MRLLTRYCLEDIHGDLEGKEGKLMNLGKETYSFEREDHLVV